MRAAPSDLLATVAELRRRLQDETDLSRIADYFDERLVTHDAFMKMGKPARNDALASMALLAIQVVLPPEEPRQCVFIHLPEFTLWHGMLLFSAHLACTVYFDDINRGVCTLGQMVPGTSLHHFRFSIPEGTTEPFDPRQAELVGMSRRTASGKPS
ncbi:MAG TPA: hypothetical protein VI197_24460 [Polyangiaceae bacterium]